LNRNHWHNDSEITGTKRTEIAKCEEHFNSIIDEVTIFYPLDPEDINALKGFIFNSDRNEKVFQEHVYRLTHA
jgi:hypothetical protein